MCLCMWRLMINRSSSQEMLLTHLLLLTQSLMPTLALHTGLQWSKWATEAKAFGPQGPHHLKQSPLTKLRQSLDIRSSHGTSKSFTNMGLGKPSPVQTPGGSASPLVPNQHHLLGHGPSNHRKSLQISVGGMWAGLESPTAGSTGPKSGDVKKDKKVGSKVKALLKSKLSGGSRASSETVGSTSSTAATPTTDAPLMTAAADGSECDAWERGLEGRWPPLRCICVLASLCGMEGHCPVCGPSPRLLYDPSQRMCCV